MHSLISSCRCLMFALFIVSNAVVCGVSIWNFLIAQAINANLQVDGFVIFLGAFGLAFTFLMIFTELARKDPFTCHVWFECSWVGTFFTLNFTGAVSLSVVLPSLICDPSDVSASPNSCSSTQVLLAFTWISSIILLAYLLLLLISAIVWSKIDPGLWQRPARHFTLSDSPGSGESMPTSASGLTTRKRKSFMSIIAPRPRAAVPPAFFSYSSEKETPAPKVEPFYIRPLSAIMRPPPAAQPPSTTQRSRNNSVGYSAAQFYPVHVQSNLPYRGEPAIRIKGLPPTPPPLGDWPRTNAAPRPVRTKRRHLSTQLNYAHPAPVQRATTSSTFSPTHAAPSQPPPSSTISAPTAPPSTAPLPVAPPLQPAFPPRSLARPSGPRSRAHTGDWNRPPPLDLSKVSSFGERTRRRA